MDNLIGVKYKKGGGICYLNCGNVKYEVGERVVVEIKGNTYCVKVVKSGIKSKCKKLSGDNKIIRRANSEDIQRLKQNKVREAAAEKIFEAKVKKNKLQMKFIAVECMFTGNKILFYFTAESRIDFRKLVCDLAAALHARIELRQIGVRDEAKKVGGIGVCGQPFCCVRFMDDFFPVSIKMAKDQSISLNPTKISGMCGKLMCCLKFEQHVYDELMKKMPKVGAIVQTPSGKGKVVESNLLMGTFRVSLSSDAAPVTFKAKEVHLLKDAKVTVSNEEMEEFKNLL